MQLSLLIVGYLLGLPVVVWCLRDIGSFRRRLWPGYGSRGSWRKGAIVAYAVGGWPVLAFTLGWRTGRTRAGLVEERERLHESASGSRSTLIGPTSVELDEERAGSDVDVRRLR